MRDKFFGVVEGFYRKPYTFRERRELVAFLADIGLNTYVYGPKNDVYHRAKWQRLYPRSILKQFENLVKICKKRSIWFNYALSPVVEADTERVVKKINSLVNIGVDHFSLFFDDIKVELSQKTADAQVTIANELLSFLRRNISDPVLLFCPTQYRGFLETEYLKTVANTLEEDVLVLWTGKHVVSKKITVFDVDKITKILKRNPLIWDNIFANDYIPGMILNFPYRHREPEIVERVKGILINPMNHYEKSKPLIYTAAKFFKRPHDYIPREAWREARQILGSSNKS